MKTFEDPKKNIGCGCDSTKDEYRRDISEMEEAEMFDNGPRYCRSVCGGCADSYVCWEA